MITVRGPVTLWGDLMRLQDRVLYSDNEVDLDTAFLPVPDPTEGL